MLTRLNQYRSAEVWSQPDCPACIQAKKMLERKGIPFQEYVLTVDVTKEQLIQKVPNARSVPQIFLDGSHIGGLLELTRLLDDNYQRATMEQRV